MSIKSKLKKLVHAVGSKYIREICHREYLSQQFIGINERPLEYQFVFKHISLRWPKTILDVGTGTTALPQLLRGSGMLVTAIDNISDYWPEGMVNRHFHVLDDSILAPTLQGAYDLITCVSTLEHIENHQLAMQNMLSMLVPEGVLLVTCPYTESQYVPNVYALPGSIGEDKYSFKTQSFSRRELDGWLKDQDCRIIDQEYWQFFSGAFWTLGERLLPPRKATCDTTHQLTCLAIQRT